MDEQNQPIQQTLKPNPYLIPTAIVIAGLIVAGAIVYSSKDGSQNTVKGNTIQTVQNNNGTAKISADDDPMLGNADAKVTIIEFSDFQCPFCRRLWRDTLGQIKKNYIDTGKAKLVYRDFPLSFHPAAQISAEAGECADDQGKFWQMHDKMFSEQEKQGTGTISYDVEDLRTWAAQIGVNVAQFNDCLDSGKYKDEVEKDLADGSAAGVTGTPALFINGKLIMGAQPYATFAAAIDAALKE